MIVLNAGVPRSGTVLVNAILRELFALRKVPVAQANPHGAALPQLLARLIESGTRPCWCIPIAGMPRPHGCLPPTRTSLALPIIATRAMSASR